MTPSQPSCVLLLALAPFAAGCGGGGSVTTSPPGLAVSAGADSEALPAETVALVGTTTGPLSLSWAQVGGPPVVIADLGAGRATFEAPTFNARIDVELRGRSASGDIVATDVRRVTVRTVRTDLEFDVAARFTPGGSGSAAPVAVAYEETSQRAFVIDEAANAVLAVDLTDPSSPQDAGVVPVPSAQGSFVPGPPRALAAGRGHLAIAYDAIPAEDDGRLVFFDPFTLAELASLPLGPRPVDVERAFEESKFLVACAADPVPGETPGTVVDGRGSVTRVRVPVGGPQSIQLATDVMTVDFTAFDGQRAALLADGVRLARPSIDVSRDLEPRAIALLRFQERAWVALPANNAVALVDFGLGAVESIRGLDEADFSEDGLPASADTLARFSWIEARPTITVDAGSAGLVELPALDIAAITPVTTGGVFPVFDFVMGRGPIREINPFPAEGWTIHFDPAFEQRLVRASVDPQTGEWTVISERPLRTSSGAPITGLPNLLATQWAEAFHDVRPVDANGQALSLDPFGAAFTGVTRVGDELWCSDAMRPSLYRFDSTGVLIDRYVPIGSGAFGVDVGLETLPTVYAQRRTAMFGNSYGGFQGIARTAGGLIATIVAVPLDNPDVPLDASSRTSRTLRLLFVDPNDGAPVHEYAVVVDSSFEPVSDLAWFDGALHMVQERACTGARELHRIDTSDATDLLALGPNQAAVSAGLEQTDPADLATAFSVPVVPAARTLVCDLSASGLSDGRGFSIAEFDAGLLFATADDFRVPQLVGSGGASAGVVCSFRLDQVARASVGLLELRPRSFDPSDLDGGFGLRNHPVGGIRQVVDLVMSETFSIPALVYAIDGDLVRDVPGMPPFAEATAARSLMLDTAAFPGAAVLQGDAQLGPLRVSTLDGDSNGDGLYESLHAFGGRSLLTLDEHLAVVHDSGDAIARGVRDRHPALLPQLDSASPLAGANPTAGASVGFGRGLVVAFRDVGLVAFFDTANPDSPKWTDTVPMASGALPVDLATFMTSTQTGMPRSFVVVADRANGTVDVIEVIE